MVGCILYCPIMFLTLSSSLATSIRQRGTAHGWLYSPYFIRITQFIIGWTGPHGWLNIYSSTSLLALSSSLGLCPWLSSQPFFIWKSYAPLLRISSKKLRVRA